ncbi:MAG: ABC transporter permease [Phyllobacteriaceae bacterium]|jgi:ribose transport system permease protein|nr:ABC transporter permease [Phyllobacteriaceae bacterium]
MSNPALPGRSNLRRALSSNGALLAVIALLILLVLVGAGLNDRFATVSNLTNVFEQSAGLGLVSLGQTLTVLTAGIDLSVGSMMSLISTLASGLIDGDLARAAWVIPALLVLAAAIGGGNGLLIHWLGVHPLIVTLGTGTVMQGVVLLYSLTPTGAMPFELEWIAYDRFLGLPIGATITVLLFVLVALMLRYTTIGRDVYAYGDDPEAARLMGISQRKVLIFVYAMSGFFAGLAGLYLSIRFGIGDPYQGQNYTLASITPVVVGGTMLTGGRGGVIGTLFGVLLVSLLNNLLNFLQVSTHLQLVVQGLIIIAAVSIYIERKRGLA